MALIRLRWSIVLVVALVAAACGLNPRPSTELQIEINGGFAYVHTAQQNMLEVAYLKDTNVPQCAVPQIGTDLMVVSGTVVEPADVPPDRMFKLDGVVVTFPDLGDLPLRAPRHVGQPQQPADPTTAAQWEDLKWVPGIAGKSGAVPLHPDWRARVSGRLVLRGGVVKGLHPSDVNMQAAVFDLKDTHGASTTHATQAITDRTLYVGKVSRDRVVIQLTRTTPPLNGTLPTRIVVTPTATGRPVKLKLMGAHAPHAPPLTPGSPVADFCAFFQLLQPALPPSDWLIPHLASNTNFGNTGGQPSPGAFCPGGWF